MVDFPKNQDIHEFAKNFPKIAKEKVKEMDAEKVKEFKRQAQLVQDKLIKLTGAELDKYKFGSPEWTLILDIMSKWRVSYTKYGQIIINNANDRYDWLEKGIKNNKYNITPAHLMTTIDEYLNTLNSGSEYNFIP